jgi:hypothetical protein
MPSFLPGYAMFAVAGAIAATGPVIIHLLNRRRFRIVPWAAMDFLREAMNRNRRVMHLRDILLLILRTAAVLLFGLALARPFFARSGSSQVNPGQPLHAIVVVDNSMSMGYRPVSDTLLVDAKARGRELIEALPQGSRITILPLCGGSEFSRDAYRTKKDALEALERIEVVDRAGTAAQAADLAREGMEQAPDVPAAAKRIIFLGDQQAENWKGETASHLKGLGEMQVVDVSAKDPENSWISDFHLLDGLADVSAPARFIVKVTRQGHSDRPNTQVTLSVDGSEVQSKTIDLKPDQTAEVTFDYQFLEPPPAGGVRWSVAKVSLPPDALPTDDSRSMVVPVVSALPVVFVDQYGETEDAKRNRLGETRILRNGLAPQMHRGQTQPNLVRVVQRRFDQLDQKDLRDARLVVIAGVARPDSADTVRLLRDYVRQGGQLVIAAGAEFDPAAWNEIAWKDGNGILPLPLQPHALGSTPDEGAKDIKALSLAVTPLDVGNSAYLQLPETDPQEIVDSLREPTFFKTIVPIDDAKTIGKLVESETTRLEEQRGQLAELDAQIQKLSEKELRGQLDNTDRQALEQHQRRRAEIAPSWLLFDSQRGRGNAELSPAEQAERSRPRITLRYDNNVPFLVERSLGRGQVLMFSSGLLSSWNNLPRTNAMWLVDRVLRSRLEYTLPDRNVDTSAPPVFVPVNASERNEPYVLIRPDGKQQPLEVQRVGRDEFGVEVGNFAERGIYHVAMHSPQSAADLPDDKAAKSAADKAAADKTAAAKSADKSSADKSSIAGAPQEHEEVIAANGPASESQLASITEVALATRLKGTEGKGDNTALNYRWVGRGDQISLSGAEVWGQDTWWWLILLLLVALLVEMLILAWPSIKVAREARETS